MFLITNFIPEVASLIKIINRWNILPICYPYILTQHRSNYKFSALPKFYQTHWAYHLVILLATVIFCAIRIKYDSETFFKYTINMFMFTAYFLLACTVVFHKIYATEFANFLNQLLLFEKRHCQTLAETIFWHGNHTCRLICLISRFFYCCHVTDSVTMALTSAILPGVAWNVTPSLVFDSLLGKYVAISRTFILLYDYIAWRTFSNFCSINIILNLLMSPYLLHCCLVTFIQKLNYLGRNPSKIGIRNRIQLYRELQILTQLYNNTHKILEVSVHILLGIFCFIACSQGLLSHFRELDISARFLLSSAVLWATIIILFCFHFPVKIKLTSRICQRKCKTVGADIFRKNCSINRVAKDQNEIYLLFVKSYKSCAPLKIKFFSSNHFDRLTPLMFFKFSVQMAIKLTLIEE